MRITMLGTGSADGWPNAFCECPSCEQMRAEGHHRSPSSALIDGVLLVDCGPTAQHAVGRAGSSLARARDILITHGHPDHLHPAILLSRQWIRGGPVLRLWGPSNALETCRDWLAPDAPVELHAVTAGEAFALDTQAGTYAIEAIAAAHGHGNGDTFADEALLYAITGPDGHRLLYATDTGVLPAVSLRQVSGRFDAVLVEETFGTKDDHGHGHLDLTSLPRMLEGMRGAGWVDDATDVVAIHLSHHNPPPAQLRPALASMGVRMVDDLDVIQTRTAGHGHHSFITGGARSGKSRLAEERAAAYPHVTYVATARSRADDPEWQSRVREHRERRPDHWTTVETMDLQQALRDARAGTAVIVDCLTMWLTQVLDDLGAWVDTGFSEADPRLQEAFGSLTRALRACQADAFVVSNEVGSGLVPDTASGRLFRDCLGQLNARAAQACDTSYLVVAGQALALRPSGPPPRPATKDTP